MVADGRREGALQPLVETGHSIEPAGLGQPVDPLAQLVEAAFEGAGELDERGEARLASAALEQGNLGAVQAGEEAEVFLGDAASTPRAA